MISWTTPSTYEYTAVMAPGTVYVIKCGDPMDQLILPDPELLQPVLSQVAIISECRIKGQDGMRLEGVSLASSAVGGGKKPYDKTTISFPANTYFGKQDNCAPGGGVRIYAAASVHITAGASIEGMQIVARGDVEFSANQDVDGLSIQAGQNIRMTANEPLRVCRRLQLLRDWSYDKADLSEIFTGSARACRADGA